MQFSFYLIQNVGYLWSMQIPIYEAFFFLSLLQAYQLLFDYSVCYFSLSLFWNFHSSLR